MAAPRRQIICPKCGADRWWRNGKNATGKKQFRCLECGRIWTPEPYIATDVITIADRMLKNGIRVPVAAEILDGFVSRRWLYQRRIIVNGRDL